jgi:hypothetical protein
LNRWLNLEIYLPSFVALPATPASGKAYVSHELLLFGVGTQDAQDALPAIQATLANSLGVSADSVVITGTTTVSVRRRAQVVSVTYIVIVDQASASDMASKMASLTSDNAFMTALKASDPRLNSISSVQVVGSPGITDSTTSSNASSSSNDGIYKNWQ